MLRNLTPKEVNTLTQTGMVEYRGKNNKVIRETDNFKYSLAIICASVVFPPLTDVGLQESHGVSD